MARRAIQAKPARPAGRSVGRTVERRSKVSTRLNLDGLSAEQKVAALLRDRAMLLERLAAAELRAETLQSRQSEIADRIAWAIDTLRDLARHER